MLQLREFRDGIKGLPDLLPWAAMIENGIVLCKNGALMAGWFYAGPDNASLSEREQELISARVNAAITRLGKGWMTHFDAVRVESVGYPSRAQSHFTADVPAAIDAERRLMFEAEGAHYEGSCVLTVTYLPPLRSASRVSDIMFSEGGGTTSLGDRIVKRFRQSLAEIQDALSAAVQLDRMRDYEYVDGSGERQTRSDLLQYLNHCVTGNNHPIRLPVVPMFLDTLIGGQELYTGIQPVVGGKQMRVLSIDGFPSEAYPGILTALNQQPLNYRWSTRFIYMDAHDAVSGLKKYRRKWQQKVRGLMDQLVKSGTGVVNQDAQAMVGQTDAAIAEAESNLMAYGYYTSVVVLMADDAAEVEENSRELKKSIERLGFSARLETVNTVEAWLGSLPANGTPNVRRPLLSSLQMADMLPLSSIWPGHAQCPSPFLPPGSPPLLMALTDGVTPFRLNLHVGDVGHTLMFGPTGAGKSTALCLIAAQWLRYPNATVFAFDKDYSMEVLCKASGGTHYDLASGAGFAPLSQLDTSADLAWACEYIETLLRLQGVDVTPKQRSEIMSAMSALQASSGRSMSDFADAVQDQDIRDALAYYRGEGAAGVLLDAEQDDLEIARFAVFEIGKLMEMPQKISLPVLLYLFRRLEQALQGQPALMPLDEAWMMLGHEAWRSKLKEWLKVLRKKNCVVLPATQSLSDAIRSGIFDVLVESCPTKILLPNPEARTRGTPDNPGPLEMYQMMGLSNRQIDTIETSFKKRHYYITSPEGNRRIELGLGPLTLAFVGVSGSEELAEARKVAAEYGDNWPTEWIKRRTGITYDGIKVAS